MLFCPRLAAFINSDKIIMPFSNGVAFRLPFLPSRAYRLEIGQFRPQRPSDNNTSVLCVEVDSHEKDKGYSNCSHCIEVPHYSHILWANM